MLLQERACTAEVAAELQHVRDTSRQQLEQEVQHSSALADQLAKLTNAFALKEDVFKKVLEHVGDWPVHVQY